MLITRRDQRFKATIIYLYYNRSGQPAKQYPQNLCFKTFIRASCPLRLLRLWFFLLATRYRKTEHLAIYTIDGNGYRDEGKRNYLLYQEPPRYSVRKRCKILISTCLCFFKFYLEVKKKWFWSNHWYLKIKCTLCKRQISVFHFFFLFYQKRVMRSTAMWRQ